MKVRCRRFESATQSWADMCEEVSAFATEIGSQNLINISVSASSGGSDIVTIGTIFVWYWG